MTAVLVVIACVAGAVTICAMNSQCAKMVSKRAEELSDILPSNTMMWRHVKNERKDMIFTHMLLTLYVWGGNTIIVLMSIAGLMGRTIIPVLIGALILFAQTHMTKRLNTLSSRVTMLVVG